MISQRPLHGLKKGSPTTMKAAIVSIGDEVILGESVDTNTAWLAGKLVERSIVTIEHRTVPDDRAAIASAVKNLCQVADMVLLTGGLGPTDDDLTREALGDVVSPGEPLETDAEALRLLEERFARQRRTMPRSNRRQAQRPASMRCLSNPHGTAPGLAGRHGECLLFALPGPPLEMKPMFIDHVVPELPSVVSADALQSGYVHAFGIGESEAAQRLGDLTRRDRQPLIGTTVSGAIVTARIRAIEHPDRAREMIETDAEQVERLWRPYAFGRDDATLAGSVGQFLLEANRTLVTAESCTGGWLGKMLVDVPGSSAYYLGGYVTYSNDMKTTCLAVSHELIEAHGAVSRQVAEAMASGAMANVDADCALAITGVAGPEGGSVSKPVGTVFITLAQIEDALVSLTTRRFVFPGDRATIRARSAQAALQMLRFALLKVPEETPLLWEMKGEKVTK